VATTQVACVPLLVKRHTFTCLEGSIPEAGDQGSFALQPGGRLAGRKAAMPSLPLGPVQGARAGETLEVQVVLFCPRTRRQGRWRQRPGWAAFCLSKALAGVSKTSAVTYPPDRKYRALSSYLPPDGTPAGNTPDHPTPNNPTGGGGVQNTPILARAYLLRSQVERPPRIQTSFLHTDTPRLWLAPEAKLERKPLATERSPLRSSAPSWSLRAAPLANAIFQPPRRRLLRNRQ
jgi:hypothetical protein